MHKMLISILFITEKRQRIKSMAQVCFRSWFSSCNSLLHELLHPIFINGKNSCKNIKQKHGTYSMINRLKMIYPGAGGSTDKKKLHVNISGQWFSNCGCWTEQHHHHLGTCQKCMFTGPTLD